jgi:hypothetical protein
VSPPLLARKTRNASQESVRLLTNPGRIAVRLEPPGDQLKKGESQWRGIFGDGIAE